MLNQAMAVSISVGGRKTNVDLNYISEVEQYRVVGVRDSY